nr:tryptophan halogenase family protein [uncultured Undibacterium sp.]
MANRPIRKIVIVGGGTAGWMTAAPLTQRLGKDCEIVLVESPDIGTVGVGEATLPTIRFFNKALGLDGADFIKKTQATFKLGIEFKDWGHLGNRFFHGFGDFGPTIENRSPHMHWLRLAKIGDKVHPLEDYSVAAVMARNSRFTPPVGDRPSASNAFSYGFHFDASLYAAYLRDYAMQRGVKRIEATISDVELKPQNGFIAAVKLRDGRSIEGDLFIDCSGFRGLLIEGALKAGYDDWSEQLPCNSALAVPCAKVAKLTPFTTSTAKSAGWQWRIPLQHRTGNGHVYCNAFTTDDEAARVLLEGLDGHPLGEPRQLRFTTGRRRKSWLKNCVAIGLSAGFLEPLESTSLSLIETAVGALIQNFPDCDFRPELADEFNRQLSVRYESVRDFIIMHYKLTNRSDTEFWRYCSNMQIPDSLSHQIELFRECGRVVVYDQNGFLEPSLISIMMGLGVTPKAYDPFVEQIDINNLRRHFSQLQNAIALTVRDMPDHSEYIARYVAA